MGTALRGGEKRVDFVQKLCKSLQTLCIFCRRSALGVHCRLAALPTLPRFVNRFPASGQAPPARGGSDGGTEAYKKGRTENNSDASATLQKSQIAELFILFLLVQMVAPKGAVPAFFLAIHVAF